MQKGNKATCAQYITTCHFHMLKVTEIIFLSNGASLQFKYLLSETKYEVNLEKCVEIWETEKYNTSFFFTSSNINMRVKRSVYLFSLFFFACPRFFIIGISSHGSLLPTRPNTCSCWLTQKFYEYLFSTPRLSPRLTIGLLAGESTYL